ncbi:hypothetical protein PLICRDRAFT_458960 [Plicaturopsis crispa FD-325 SS-3]|nr:hypothetical protein PLICRDRAFT_458960 [Plicaturopsis crispa FD-325 SS-3]
MQLILKSKENLAGQRGHQTRRHLAQARLQLSSTASAAPSSSFSSRKATVEDFYEDDNVPEQSVSAPDMPFPVDFFADASRRSASPQSSLMFEALSGRISFSAGRDDAVSDQFAATLRDAINGVPILEAATWPAGEELPEGAVDGESEIEDDVDMHVSDKPLTAQEISASFFGGDYAKDDYFPYPNKSMMKTDILFSSPRLRFSRAQQEAVLSWAKELGADVPSLYALERFQKEALKAVGDPTEKVTTASGNVLYSSGKT